MYYINNKLFIDKIAVDSIIKKTGTPTYCYSYKKLRENILRFKSDFNRIEPLICFSVKANNNLKLLSEISKLGIGADVVSKGELVAALSQKLIQKNCILWSWKNV